MAVDDEAGVTQEKVSALWAIIQGHLDRYGVREAVLVRRLGSSPQVVNLWKKRGLKQLPERRVLEGLAQVVDVPYEDVLEAVLSDIGYLP